MTDFDTLVRRAKAFALSRYRQEVTPRMVRDWVDEGLVPGPMRHGRGRGAGTRQDWSPLAYRRVLQLSRLKQQGVTRRAAQQLALWFSTADFTYEKVHQLLISEYQKARKIAQRSMPAGWDPFLQVEPETKHQRDALMRTLGFGIVIPEDIEQHISLDAILPYVATMVTDQPFITDATALTDLMLTMFGLRDTPLREQLIAVARPDFDFDMRVLTGILADPSIVETSAEAAITAADEETLVNARDFLRAFRWQQRVLGPALAAVVPQEVRPLLDGLVARTAVPDEYEKRFALFLHFLRRAQEKGDAGRRMGITAREGIPALRKIYRYLSRNEQARRLFEELGQTGDQSDAAVRRRGRQLTRMLIPHGLRELHRAGRKLERET